jgi:hypothetical protein
LYQPPLFHSQEKGTWIACRKISAHFHTILNHNRWYLIKQYILHMNKSNYKRSYPSISNQTVMVNTLIPKKVPLYQAPLFKEKQTHLCLVYITYRGRCKNWLISHANKNTSKIIFFYFIIENRKMIIDTIRACNKFYRMINM